MAEGQRGPLADHQQQQQPIDDNNEDNDSSPLVALKSVKNGLQLRQSNSDTVLKSYTYSMAYPYLNLQPKRVDWRLLSSFHVESEHIRIHDLNEDGDLKSKIESYRSEHAMAVIIINNEESQVLSKKFSASLEGFDNFLIAVLSSSEGSSLYEFFNDDHEIHAKLEVKSVESVASEVISLPSSEEDGDTAVISGMDSSIRNASRSDQPSKGVFGKIFFSTKPSFDVKGEIKKLVLDGETMKHITYEAGTFTLVMSSFSQYEKLSKQDSNQINNLIRTLFLPFFEPAFPTEFPFFLILAYRFKKFRLLYECDELGPFITKCIDAFEALPPAKIADTLLRFFDLKDFDIMFGSEEANTSVFSLLATACKDLMNLSAQIKRASRQSPTTPGSRFISTRMIWIIVHLKCLSEKGLAKKSDVDIWQTHLLGRQIAQNIVLSKEVIDEFKLGISFSKKLQLPEELGFSMGDMTYFVANENYIRPLASVRDFYLSLESNIKSDHELVVHIVINLRSFYTPFLSSADQRQVVKASHQETLKGVIEEGISFLDGIRKVWYDRHWNKGEQHSDFRVEILKWLKLLLSVVKLTDPNAPSLLKKFLGMNRNSIVTDPEFRKSVTDQILHDARKNFHILSIQQFFTLYKSFRIWPLNFLHEFLNQYRIPSNVRINDATWSEFFNVVLDRIRSEESQSYLFSFITKIAEKYKDSKRAKDFIPELIQLNVSQLFAAPRPSSPVEAEKFEETSVGQQFKDFLMSYIQRNNLRSVILSQLQTLITHITDKKDNVNFHWIILGVLQSVVVPELRNLEGSDNEHIRSVLPVSVNLLVQSPSWFGPLSPRQKFCWGMVSTTCSKLAVTSNNFDWVNNSTVIQQLGVIYNSYCNSRKLYGSKCLLSENTPEEIATCPWEDVKKYFQWVKKLQDTLLFWQGKFTSGSINYDELMSYASNSVALNALGRAVCAGSCIMEMDSVTQVKDNYRYNFEQLNVFLLRYVPGHPEVKYCTLPSLLSKYGVAIPPGVQDSIEKYVIFPNERSVPNKQKLINVIPAPNARQFEPGHDITLNLMQEFTLSGLQKLIEDLANFLEPLYECLNMLVFFHLHQSEMFEKHLLRHLETIIEPSSSIAQSPKPPAGGFSLVPSLMPSVTFAKSSKERTDRMYKGIPMITFKSALEGVRDLLVKIVEGTATYSDITADGAIKLETINTEKEFSTLRTFSETVEMNPKNCNGLDGVRSMLELFQFTYHIQTIDAVFEQYGLEKCRSDPTLKELLRIMEELRPEGSRAKLTPLEAIDKMNFIRKSLCLQNATSYECLNLFPAVANSAAFYQFIRDKQFVGHRGNALFHEQYQLITAQLQHEEYDENVLNHLRVAFEFLSPFMESDIIFNDLMSRVSRLDATHGLKQLETVNENITLIRLWFSRAEGDTIENVANELDNIISTGLYQFFLSGHSSSPQIYLLYKTQQRISHTQASQSQNRLAPPQTQLEESDKLSDTEIDKLGGADFTTLPAVFPSPQPQTFGGNPLLAQRDPNAPFSNITMGGVDQRWSNEQISDFVRKLGFLDAEKEGGAKIKLFLHLNTTANKLMDLYIKLYELGHPDYQEYKALPFLLCSVPVSQADKMVQETEDILKGWTEKVVALRQQYTWLLFFSVPKLLKLHGLLISDSINISAIVHSISFLFENAFHVRKCMEPVIQNALAPLHNAEEHSPMHTLGNFLETVCTAAELSPFLLKLRSSRKGSVSVPRTMSFSIASPAGSASSSALHQLHYCPGYSHVQLIRLITELYEGVPEPFEVFRCSSSTKQEELNLFTERLRHHSLTYLILEVNKLPFKLQEILMDLPRRPPVEGCDKSIVHFIETAPSVLREVPWITTREYKKDGLKLSFDAAARQCKKKITRPPDFSCIQLVAGYAGDGKTHHIRRQLSQCPESLTIAVNEAFTPLSAINKLSTLSCTRVGSAIFFNFTLMPYDTEDSQGDSERDHLKALVETISWFFFDLLVLGYVEDSNTGASFRIPGGLEWAIYIEVPSLDHNSKPEESLHLFCDALPTLGLLGSPHFIHHSTSYAVDSDVQLVCKYLRAFKAYRNGQIGINKLYKEPPPAYSASTSSLPNPIVKFSLDEDLIPEECHSLLTEYMPEHIQMTKMTQKLFIMYMKRRCAFLDTFPAFNFNTGVGEPLKDGSGRHTDTKQLGSTLMVTMLEEVTNFCHPAIQQDWSKKPHQQLIYDFRDGGSSFGLLSLNLENLPEDNKRRYRSIGFELHPTAKLQERDVLDQYLARALGLPAEEGNRLSAIDEAQYVLTLDYTIKMLNINERYECGVPVIIKGETGVGKTALVDMLSRLWSNALLYQWNKERGIIFDSIRDLLGAKAEDSLDTYQTCLETMEALAVGREVPLENLETLAELSDPTSSSGQFFTRLRQLLLDMSNNPASALLVLPSENKRKRRNEEKEGDMQTLDEYFRAARANNTSKSTALLLQKVLKARVRKTFHKLNVHAALTPDKIKKFFHPVFTQAKLLSDVYEKADKLKKSKIKLPFVTVFLDEVNTSSCLGLFKEILIDRTIDGEAIPQNVFIVAACNPHRGNSMATHAAETWVRSSYYVRPLHPTLEFLIWDYGSLNEYQERDYITAKLKMLHKQLPNIEVVTLTDLIVESQSLMRRYAARQLRKQGMKPEEVEVSSHSCVSQRDIQRVFTFYQWLMTVYRKRLCNQKETDYNRRAVMVSLGIVYYMRLDNEGRKDYQSILDRKYKLPNEVNFTQAFNDELNWFCDSIELPPGIAKTQALKENIFATIVCTVTHTPLIIVGAPGSSKTLSFNLTISNLKGPESKMMLFRDTEIFKSLDPHFYQCSRRTTSNEIQTVFSRAINRQRSHAKFSLPIYCVVFMDEAGLPEESHESLKVLHYHLDKQEVSFVAITNHVLDAAKTNRAVSLFRPEVSSDDLNTLAKGCLCDNPQNPPPELRKDLDIIVQFCPAYRTLMENANMKKFFGLRDFIHFINFLRRRRTDGLTPQLVLEGLERNFNGIYWTEPGETESFQWLCQLFLDKMKTVDGQTPVSLDSVHQRSILEVFHTSLLDRPERGGGGENEVRYKLIIDPSEDSSLVQLLMTFEVLDRKKTHVYVCSDFPGDSQVQKINTIAAIRHSAIEGHTVVMSQTDDIHESFYDLFNQRFRRIDDPEHGPRYYANIAIGAHLKPSRVHGDFQCVVVVRESEVKDTPAPFLNRFEKYCISHQTLLATAIRHLPPCIRVILQATRKKLDEFINTVNGSNSLYGLKNETLDSLLLSLLPPYGHTYQATPPDAPVGGDNVDLYLLQELLRSLRNSAGFAVPVTTVGELEMDANYIFPLLCRDASFDEAHQNLTIESAHQAVSEALRVLHTAPDPQDEVGAQIDMSPEACLAVGLLQQWLIRHMTKQLMKLMTSEAVTVHRKQIPASYIDNYLTHQQHFSLKKLIDFQLRALESCKGDNRLCNSKVLSYTRSSPIIHELPSNYSQLTDSKGLDGEGEKIISELIYSKPDKVVLSKVTSLQSQSNVQELLKSFVQSQDKQILVLVTNMQEVKQETVNHLRVMIEEAETLAVPMSCKLFVLLLHFPPVMFFDACYPSLFLRGWSHYYLDSIGRSSSAHHGTLDIEEWFQRCCFPEKIFTEDTLMMSCQHLLKEVIPVLASHVNYGTRSNGPFTRPMKASERNNKLKELLEGKGLGPKLLSVFRSFWKPSVMVEHLERAAIFTRSHESSLNITDAVQTIFQSIFTDFMIVMISRINENRNIDVLFSPDGCPDAVNKLFLALIDSVHVPKFDNLKLLASSLPVPKPQEHQPSFPFFGLIYKDMEKLIDEAKIARGQQENILEEAGIEGETPPPSSNFQNDFEAGIKAVADHVIQKIEREIQGTLSKKPAVFTALSLFNAESEELWTRYFTDFIHNCLHLEGGVTSLSHRIICAFFSDLYSQPPIYRLVFLHIYVEYNKLSLGNIASLLRPLERIWHVAEEAPSRLTPTSQSPAKEFIAAIEQTKIPFGDPQKLSQFVVSALFSSLVGSIYPKEKVEGNNDDNGFNFDILYDWYNAYLQVMTMPALVVHLYSTPLPPEEEAKFNIMQSSFLFIHSSSRRSLDTLNKSAEISINLLTRYFYRNLTLKDKTQVPRLNECANVLADLIKKSTDTKVPQIELFRRIIEGLFEHFFSQHKTNYHSEDRDWFLKLANAQQEWRASDQLLNEVVISSSYSGDLVSAMESSLKRTRYRPHIMADIPSGCVSMFVFKMYLSRILGVCEQQEQQTLSDEVSTQSTDLSYSGPLLMYQPDARQHVAEVLSADCNGDEASCYVPVFYQDCKALKKQTDSRLMQQPLCHLYFLTLLEHLMAEPRDVNSLVRLVGTISQLYRPQSLPTGEKMLLYIEKQAVVQCLLKQVAVLFNCDPNKPIKNKDLTPVIDELNEILSDESMGGGLGGGHHLSLGMHLLRHLKSARKFTELLTTRYQHLQDIHCMQGFHQQLKTQSESKPYLFPFMQVNDESQLSKLYHQVKAAMLAVDQSRGSQAAVDQLVKIADDCSKVPRKQSRPTDSGVPQIEKKFAFRMMLWLVSYYDFFFAKKASQTTSLVIANQLKPYIKDDGVIRLIQCFLFPRWLVKKPESPIPLREDAPVLQVTPNGQVSKVHYEGEEVDPLFELLIPPKLRTRDQSELDMCHCLANLIATILGCQPQSNHLWYHLFSPHELKDTYMTGFMYKSKISPEGLLYDCGVELTADGQYGRPDYIPHATRGTYTLHSLYFLLWANFGAFSISLLTQTESQTRIHGDIISDWQAVRHYCVSQLRTMWAHIRNNLGVSDEERSFLVTRCLMNMYQVNSDPNVQLIGKMRTMEELNEYESMWHNRIFLPARLELREKFSQYEILWQNQLFVNIRHLESCYPKFPSEKDFVNVIQGESGASDGEGSTDVAMLQRFVLEKERLQVGGQLLPDLIQLYQWIHTHLSHLVSLERAYNKLTIGRVIKLASRHSYPGLLDLYNRVKDKYNQYVELVGGAIGQGACAAVRRGNRMYVIADDLPFLHFLSDSQDEGDGNDWLYTVIEDIVGSQNLLVQSLYANVEGERDHPLARLLPEITYIYGTEANEHSCIVGKQSSHRTISEFLQLVRCRVESNGFTNTSYIRGTPTLLRSTPKLMSITDERSIPTTHLSFNLSQLQEVIVRHYLSGKPIIRDVSSLRTLFKFRHSKAPVIKRTVSDPMGGAYSLSSIEDTLHPSLQSSLQPNLERRLEFDFHNCSYHSLTEIVVGLKTALGHLVKVIPRDGSVSQETQNSSLRSFLCNQFEEQQLHDESNRKTNILNEIGIRNLTVAQTSFLESLPLCFVYAALSLFLRWVKEGFYDFSSLPVALKVHLSQEDSVAIDEIPTAFNGTWSQLLSELKGLNEVLIHIEAYLIKEVNEEASYRKPMMLVLKELGLLEDEEILKLIPDTVSVHHYVQLRLHLRRLISTVEQRLAIESSLLPDHSSTVWTEYVDNLWNDYLTNLRDEGFIYIDPALLNEDITGGYGFCGEDSDTDSTSGLADVLNDDNVIIPTSATMYDQDSYEPISMDYNDPLLLAGNSLTTLNSGFTTIPGVGHEMQDTLRRGLEDPHLREEMLKLIAQKKDTEDQATQARDYTPDKIADFLASIKLGQYAQAFLDEEINGSIILSADREVFADLGVASTVHATQIAVMFRRELQGIDREESFHDIKALTSTSGGGKLNQHKKKLDSAGVDVDMLLYAYQKEYLDELLKELGISKALDKTRFKDALKELSLSTPVGQSHHSTPSYIAYSTPV